MSDHRTYKKIELVGSSKLSIEDAIGNALAECAKSVRHMDWFEVVETRGHLSTRTARLAIIRLPSRWAFDSADS